MKRLQPMLLLAVALTSSQTALLAQEPSPSQQEEQRRADEEARKREAEERARLQKIRDDMQATIERVHALRPPTAAEIEEEHRRLLPDFLKHTDKFKATGAEIAAYGARPVMDAKARKEIQKRAKSLESQTHWILQYILYGQSEPPAPRDEWSENTLEERAALLGSLTASVHQAVWTRYGNRKSRRWWTSVN
jgi:hypothetical protein